MPCHAVPRVSSIAAGNVPFDRGDGLQVAGRYFTARGARLRRAGTRASDRRCGCPSHTTPPHYYLVATRRQSAQRHLPDALPISAGGVLPGLESAGRDRWSRAMVCEARRMRKQLEGRDRICSPAIARVQAATAGHDAGGRSRAYEMRPSDRARARHHAPAAPLHCTRLEAGEVAGWVIFGRLCARSRPSSPTPPGHIRPALLAPWLARACHLPLDDCGKLQQSFLRCLMAQHGASAAEL